MAIFQFTQTSTGRNAAITLVRNAIASAVDGEVRMGPVLRGNLVTRMTLEQLEIRDTEGALFLGLDTVTVEYDPIGLLTRQLRIRRLHTRDLEVRLVQDAEGVWNYQRIFRQTPSDDEPIEAAVDSADVALAEGVDAVTGDSIVLDDEEPGGLRVVLNDVSIESGQLRIQTPWTSRLEGAEKRVAVQRARAGDEVWAVEETPEGEFVRVYELDDVRGRLPLVRVVDRPRPFEVRLDEVSGRLSAVRQPLELERLSAHITLGDTVRVELERLETASSVVFGTGWYKGRGERAFNFELSADPIDEADLGWLPIPLPDALNGPMEIDLSSRAEALVVDVSEADVRSGDTRLQGGFALALPRAGPRFDALDLSLSPLRIAWLDEFLDREPTVDGTVRGRVQGSGPIDALTIEAQLTFEDLEEEVPPSALTAVGGVGVRDPFPLIGMELALESFEPRWAQVVGFDARVDGRADGVLTLDRAGGDDLRFSGDVAHYTPAGALSQLTGTGTFDFPTSSVDVSVDVNPLALSVLNPFVPDLELAGSVTGPIRARGDREALSTTAVLETDRGRLSVDGSFDLAAEQPRYDTQVEATDLSLDEWIDGAPASRLAVRGRVNGEGLEPATLDAAFDLEILPSELDQAEIYDSRVRFSIANGLASIDTVFLVSDVGVVSARGRFGLDDTQLGTLEFEADVLDLSDFDRWFVEDIPGGAAAEAGEDLFESFEAAFGVVPEEEPTEGLSGRLTARGVAVGRWEDFTVETFVDASRARYQTYRADSVSARVLLLAPPATDEVLTQLTATGVNLDGRRLDSLSVRLERDSAGAATLDLHARRDSTVEVSTRGELSGGDTWEASLERLRLRLGKLESNLINPARIVYSDSAFIVDGVALNGTLGRLQADGLIPASGDGEVLLEAFGVRVDQLGYLFSDAPEVGGTLGGTARMTGTLSDPRVTAAFRVADPSIRNQTYGGLESQVEYANQRVEGVIDLQSEDTRLARLGGTVRADLALEPREQRLLDDPIDLRLEGDSVPLALVELRVEGLEEISGIADTDLTLQGAPGELRYSGGIRVTDGRAWVPDLGVWLTAVGGRVSFRGSEARLDSAYVESDLGGSVTASGTLDIASLSDPVFDVELDPENFHAVSRLDMSLAVSGAGELGGSYTSPRLTGRYSLAEGDIRQDEFLRAREIIDLTDPTIYTLLDSASIGDRRLLERFRNPFMDNLIVDAEVSLGPNLWLRSPQLDVEMVASDLDVYVDRGGDSLSVRGGVGLQRGTYRFDRVPPYVQSLRITSGSIQFVGDPRFNPNLAINAEYRNRTAEGPVLVEAQISGTLEESTLNLSSDPPMSESDQVCFLAVGAPCALSADRTIGERLLQETFLGTLSSGISSALVGPTGLSYFNLRSVGGGQAGGGPQGSRSWFERTALEFGWYANEDIFLSLSQTLGGGPPRATVEWSFLPNWTFEARVASRFDERLFGLAQGTNLANDQTFGLFLFRDWNLGGGGDR